VSQPGQPLDQPGPEDVADALHHGRSPAELGGADERAEVAGATDPDQVTDGPVTAAGVTVVTTGAALLQARHTQLEDAATAGLASLLAAKTPTLWGPDATLEASRRLGWVDEPRTVRPILPRLAELRAELQAEGLTRVVLAGMGGSSLAPEVITRTAGVDLVVLDSTDPGQVRAALDPAELSRTVVVCSSKSGGTLETDSHRRAAIAAFIATGMSAAEAARRIVVVTDPGSPLEETARQLGVREVFLADPDVGGRYSALTAFGLVPSALAGVDVEELLDEALALEPALASLVRNPALALGAALGGGGVDGRDKVLLAPGPDSPTGFGDWAEQLIAESTGKQGRGLLPVVVESVAAATQESTGDTHIVVVGGEPPAAGSSVTGRLGALFQAWEYAVAVAGRSLSIDPFDQPNVQESKDNTNALLASYDGKGLPEGTPVLTVDGVTVYDDTGTLAGDEGDLTAVLARVLAAVPERGYLAVMAYLDRHAQADLAGLRAMLAGRLAHPVTFGWGPRFLHSTGQFHKGGPQVGVFLQVTGDLDGPDLDIPTRSFSFGRLQRAQALGDLRALGQRGRPAVRLHLTDRRAGVAALLSAAGRL